MNKEYIKKILYSSLAALVIVLLAQIVQLGHYGKNTVYATVTQLYVSTTGDDLNPGTQQLPFKTIQRSRDAVRTINQSMTDNIEVLINNGTYDLDSTITFDEFDSGTNGYSVIYKAMAGTQPRITGGKKVTGWTQSGNIWHASVAAPDKIRELYVNGSKAVRARTNTKVKGTGWYDDINDNTSLKDGIFISDSIVGSWANPSDIELHWSAGWKSISTVVDSILSPGAGQKVLKMKQPYFSRTADISISGFPAKYDAGFYIENAYELLDKPGEFYLNRQTDTLYYWPREGENMSNAEVYMPVLEVLIELKGQSLSSKVKNIQFNGITFMCATWLKPSQTGWFTGQAQTLMMESNSALTPANIQLSAAENIFFKNNVFKDFGCVGIGLYEGVNNCEFTGNVFADIGDSAMTIGYPTHDKIESTVDVALGKTAQASSIYSLDYNASMAVDGNISSGWHSGSDDIGKTPWWKVDLGAPCKITQITFVPRYDVDQAETRRNFEIQASNDSNFSTYTILGSQGSQAFPHMQSWVCSVVNSNSYRYIRFAKTAKELAYISEFKVDSIQEEACKYNLIKNNYITRVGDYFWGAPGIQAYYVESLEISHNYLYDIPYSGIALGWGWSETDTTTCKNNKINNNKIKGFMRECADGGGIYLNGQSPGSEVKNNYISDETNCFSAIYPDEGSRYYTVSNNVLENVDTWIFISTNSIKDITASNNYSTTSFNYNYGTNCTIPNATLFVSGKAPQVAQSIMDNAGLESSYNSIITNAPLSNQRLFGIEPYNGMLDYNDRERFNAAYLWPPYFYADSIYNLAVIGDSVGQFTQAEKDILNTARVNAYVVSQDPNSSKETILKTRLDTLAAIQNYVYSDLKNVGLNKVASCASYYNSSYSADKAFDNSNSSGWANGYIAEPQYLKVDLGLAYPLRRIELTSRVLFDSERCNFEIQASNDSNFITYDVLGSQGATPHNGNWSVNLSTNKQYRYIRAQKTTMEGFYISELRILSTGVCDFAQQKPASASSVYGSGFEAEKSVDANIQTGWSPAGGPFPNYVQVDLGSENYLDRVEFVTRQDVNQPDTRKDFSLLASNDSNFSSYVVLGSQLSTALPYQGTWIINVGGSTTFNSSKYRYIRLTKTNSDYFFVSELKVFTLKT